jgi:hypothetical protein
MAAEPVAKAGVVRADERLAEQRPHRGADDRGVEGVDPAPEQDEPGPADGLRGPDQGAEVPLGAHRLEHGPAEAGTRRGAVQRRPPLRDDGTDAGGAVCRGNQSEGLGRDVDGWDAGPALVADELAGDGDGEELFAVDERLDVGVVLDGLDDVPHALDEEGLASVPVRAIGLEWFDLIERGPDIGRKMTFVDFIQHSPFGEPEARYEAARADHARDRTRAVAIREAGDRIHTIAFRARVCPGGAVQPTVIGESPPRRQRRRLRL